jgi:hypothetical protein
MVTDKVWVVQVEWYGPEGGDYAGWTSVHRTYEGAEAQMLSRCEEYGIDLDAVDQGIDESGSYGSMELLELQE